MRTRTSRAVLGILATTAVAGAVAGGSPGARSAGPFVGTWTIVPKAGTPWASGGTLTVSAASKSEVMGLGPVCDGCGLDRKDGKPVPFGNNGYEDKCIGFDPAIWGEGSTNPTVSAWYVLTFSWPSPKMGGCVSNKTAGSIAFFGNPHEFRGFMAARPDGTIFGAWVKDPGSLGFEGASKGSGGTGGGGATTTVTARSFGRPVTQPAPADATLGVVSPPLPAGTKTVDVDAEFTDADIEKMAAALRLAIDQYNTRKQTDLYRRVIICFGTGARGVIVDPTLCDDIVTLFGGRTPAATGACRVAYLPVPNKGVHLTAAQKRQAVAFARSLAPASCSRSGDKVSLHLAARGKATLNGLLGARARLVVERTSGGDDGPKPRLSVTWRR